MKVALVIGHNLKNQGATNKNHGISEFMFNEVLAKAVAIELTKKSIESEIVYRGATYFWLPRKVNKTNADIAISLHCNAFNTEVSGTETLFYKGSEKGEDLAYFMQRKVVKCLNSKDRGLRSCIAKYKGRAGDKGGHLLKKTKMPCIIVEPFFIDHDDSLLQGMAKTDDLAEAYANAVYLYFALLNKNF